MSDAPQTDASEIGIVSGSVWKYLHENGSSSITRLVKEIGEPRDRVMQAIGWLAREDKITFHQSGRGRQVSLK